MRDGGSALTSHNAASVRPSKCHPPGDADGYTAVYEPAIATDPAGTAVRGVARRGRTSRRSSPDR